MEYRKEASSMDTFTTATCKAPMTPIYDTETLKAKMKNGKLKYWTGHIGIENGVYYTFSSYWHDTGRGTSVIQYSAPYEVKAVNVGKANERRGYDQAMLMITSDFNNQISKGYFVNDESEAPLLPMLAKTYAPGKCEFPAIAQAKIDGMRAIWKDGKFISRLGKEILPEVTEHIRPSGDFILDGELCLPTEYGFQDTMKAAKKKCDLSSKLVYHIFDIIDPNMKMEDRMAVLRTNYMAASGNRLNAIAPSSIPGAVIVNGFEAGSHEELMKLHDTFVSDGYEGVMIRKRGAMYEIGRRSAGLLKYKTFIDSEFVVVGIREGEGKEKGLALLQCVTKEGAPFDCRPKGTDEYRRELWLNRDAYIGAKVTVRYQKPLDTNIPRFPRAIGFREDV